MKSSDKDSHRCAEKFTRIPESLHSLLRMHWDHEPAWVWVARSVSRLQAVRTG